MATAAFHRLGLLVRGTAGLSLTKQLDVVFAENSSLYLIKRGILPSRQAGVGKTVNGRTFIEHKLYYICGKSYKVFSSNFNSRRFRIWPHTNIVVSFKTTNFPELQILEFPAPARRFGNVGYTLPLTHCNSFLMRKCGD